MSGVFRPKSQDRIDMRSDQFFPVALGHGRQVGWLGLEVSRRWPGTLPIRAMAHRTIVLVHRLAGTRFAWRHSHFLESSFLRLGDSRSLANQEDREAHSSQTEEESAIP